MQSLPSITPLSCTDRLLKYHRCGGSGRQIAGIGADASCGAAGALDGGVESLESAVEAAQPWRSTDRRYRSGMLMAAVPAAAECAMCAGW